MDDLWKLMTQTAKSSLVSFSKWVQGTSNEHKLRSAMSLTFNRLSTS